MHPYCSHRQDVWASSEESKASSSRIAGLLMSQDRKDIELAVKLIKEGEGVHYISPKTGEGALHVACIWGHEDAVEALLYGGADPNLRTRVETGLDMTPLTWCAYGCHRNSIRKFIADDRVDVNMIVRDEDHGLITALDIAMRIGDRCGEAAHVLKNAGAKTFRELQAEHGGNPPGMPPGYDAHSTQRSDEL